MGQLRKFMSIRNTMILAFIVLIAVIVLCLSLASYSYTISDFENLSIHDIALLLGEINFSIDAYIENMKSMAEVVARNEDVCSLMAFYNRRGDAEMDTDELYALQQRVLRHMDIVANTRNDITNIAVVSQYGDAVLSDETKTINPHAQYTQADWFLQPLMHRDTFFLSPSHVQNLIQDEYKWVISISKALTDPDSGETIGVMVVDLNYRVIETICENADLGQVGYIYLMDAQRNLIYHPQQQLIYSGIKSEDYNAVLSLPDGLNHIRAERENKLYIRSLSETTGWVAVGVLNTQHLIRNRSGILRFYLLLAYVAIVLAGVLAVLIAGAITKPIQTLETTMRQVELGNFSVWSDIKSNNEIGRLSNTFNAMVAQIRHLMEDLIKNESEKRKSELRSLQAQINPHFLYNTLDTIIWMSASGKNQEVVEITNALAHLFRSSVSQGGDLVELDVELTNIESYLTIQKRRYMDKLSYHICAEAGTRHLVVPKLILQPIVENAIYHGIKPSNNGGEILIRTALADGRLIVTVSDNGVGMTPEQLSRIWESGGEDRQRMGVLNVHNRIQLVFGAAYGLEYHSTEGQGTCVDICLPAVEKGELPDV